MTAMNDKTLVERLQNVNDADLWGDKTCQIVDAAFETVPRNPNDHDEAVAYRRAITALQSRIEALEAALRDIKNAVLQGDMTDIVAWQRLVIACQTTAKQALEGSGNG